MSEKVKVKVVKGSVSTWEDGTFMKGDIFETTREKALKIDPSFIEIIEVEPAPESVPRRETETQETIQPVEEPKKVRRVKNA